MSDRNEKIAEHIRCPVCGYDVFSLPVDGQCPECGHNVDDVARLRSLCATAPVGRLARRACNTLFVSTIAAGWCPLAVFIALICDQIDSLDVGIGRDVPMGLLAVSFSVYAVVRLRAEALLNQLLIAVGLCDYDGEGRPFIRYAVPVLIANWIAIIALAVIDIMPMRYIHFYRVSDVTGNETHLMLAIGGSLFVLSLIAWRSIPIWRNQTLLASRLGMEKTKLLMRRTVRTKTIYETLWLTCCWGVFALEMAPYVPNLGWLYALVGLGSFFGMFGFGIIWILMLIAGLQLRRKIIQCTVVN